MITILIVLIIVLIIDYFRYKKQNKDLEFIYIFSTFKSILIINILFGFINALHYSRKINFNGMDKYDTTYLTKYDYKLDINSKTLIHNKKTYKVDSIIKSDENKFIKKYNSGDFLIVLSCDRLDSIYLYTTTNNQ